MIKYHIYPLDIGYYICQYMEQIPHVENVILKYYGTLLLGTLLKNNNTNGDSNTVIV